MIIDPTRGVPTAANARPRSDQVLRCLVPRKSFAKLYADSRRDATVGEHDEHEQESTGGGRDLEEIRRHDQRDLISEECRPRLGRWPSRPNQVFRNTRFADLDAELLQLAMNAGNAPQRIGMRHRPDQGTSIGWNGWATETVPTFPVQNKRNARRLPSDDRVGLDVPDR